MGADVGFCPKCGKPASSAAAPGGAAPPPAQAAAGSGLDGNVAALLSYVLGWLTGLIFFLIDKRPYVRFHAMQSIVTFGALHVIQLILVFGGVFGGLMGGLTGGLMFGGIAWMLYALFNLVILVTWILCMVKAYQGQRFKLPVVGNLAEGFAK
ncbi:MAG: DUF4870 domain-containing protein [Acidobacteria bacterium]|nr:DUF4870 domain-containing protein [Acidobacteriota bacterium]